MKTDNKILELSFNFSISIIQLYKQLTENKEFVISKQLLKSDTSIGTNIEEAIAAIQKRLYFKNIHCVKRSERDQVRVEII